MIVIYVLIMSMLSGVNPALTYSVVKTESNFKPAAMGDRGRSYGLFQIKCSTARGMGFKAPCSKLRQPATNTEWGLKYLALQLDKYGEHGISAYNAGSPFLCAEHKSKCKKKRLYVNNVYVDKVNRQMALLNKYATIY